MLDVEDLSHPLIPAPQRVGNSMRLQHGQVLVLTGANASGKSTWMRTMSLCIFVGSRWHHDFRQPMPPAALAPGDGDARA